MDYETAQENLAKATAAVAELDEKIAALEADRAATEAEIERARREQAEASVRYLDGAAELAFDADETEATAARRLARIDATLAEARRRLPTLKRAEDAAVNRVSEARKRDARGRAHAAAEELRGDDRVQELFGAAAVAGMPDLEVVSLLRS